MADFLGVKTNLMAPSALQRNQHQRRLFAAAVSVLVVVRAAFAAQNSAASVKDLAFDVAAVSAFADINSDIATAVHISINVDGLPVAYANAAFSTSVDAFANVGAADAVYVVKSVRKNVKMRLGGTKADRRGRRR